MYAVLYIYVCDDVHIKAIKWSINILVIAIGYLKEKEIFFVRIKMLRN